MNSERCSRGRPLPPVAPARNDRLHRRLSGALILLFLAGCLSEMLPLPQTDDPMFVRMAGIQFGMRQSELLRRRPSIEASRAGELREAYGPGWITYGFRSPMDPRLSSVRVWMPLADSVSLRERREDLVASLSLRSAYGIGPEFYCKTSNHLDEIRAVWQGRPSTGVSSQIFASTDRRGYSAELVVLVRDSGLPVARGQTPCAPTR